MGIYGHKRFTEEQLETLEKENLMTEEERKYKCTLCEKVYKYKRDLNKYVCVDYAPV